MKKIFSLLVCIVMLANVFIVFADETTPITITVNGVAVECDVAPFIEDGRTLVPIRAITEAIGCTVVYNEESEQIQIQNEIMAVALKIGNQTVAKLKRADKSNQERITLDVPPKIVDGRTFVPARAIAEAFDAAVNWDGETKTVVITTDYTNIEKLDANGLGRVKKNTENGPVYGYIDVWGTQVIPIEYDYAQINNNNNTIVGVNKEKIDIYSKNYGGIWECKGNYDFKAELNDGYLFQDGDNRYKILKKDDATVDESICYNEVVTVNDRIVAVTDGTMDVYSKNSDENWNCKNYKLEAKSENGYLFLDSENKYKILKKDDATESEYSNIEIFDGVYVCKMSKKLDVYTKTNNEDYNLTSYSLISYNDVGYLVSLKEAEKTIVYILDKKGQISKTVGTYDKVYLISKEDKNYVCWGKSSTTDGKVKVEFIGKNGETEQIGVYDYVGDITKVPQSVQEGGYAEAPAYIKNENGWGLINQDGDIIANCKYYRIDSEGFKDYEIMRLGKMNYANVSDTDRIYYDGDHEELAVKYNAEGTFVKAYIDENNYVYVDFDGNEYKYKGNVMGINEYEKDIDVQVAE